jgi:type IV pilus assembly protein PilP
MARRLSRFSALLIAVFALLLGGCVSHNISDLEQWCQQVLKRPGGRIAPLPEIQPYEAYAYKAAAAGKRDPFTPFYTVEKQEKEKLVGSGLTKEQRYEVKDRNREELEQYELDSLKMVGTMSDKGHKWGLIKDPTGVVHRVEVGNYMGRHIGKITNIFDDKIELRELIQDSQGHWHERPAAIALAE